MKTYVALYSHFMVHGAYAVSCPDIYTVFNNLLLAYPFSWSINEKVATVK